MAENEELKELAKKVLKRVNINEEEKGFVDSSGVEDKVVALALLPPLPLPRFIPLCVFGAPAEDIDPDFEPREESS